MAAAILKKAPSQFVQIIVMYLGFIHMSRYIKKHKPTQKDIAKFLDKVKEMEAKIQYDEVGKAAVISKEKSPETNASVNI